MSTTQSICETRPRADGKKWCAVRRLSDAFSVDNVPVGSFKALTEAANAFLADLKNNDPHADNFEPYASWFTELKSGTGGFRWLPVTWGDDAIEAKLRDPRNSFWVTPTDADGITRRALVMIATTGTQRKDGKFVADPFRCSIRVVAHVDDKGGPNDQCSLRFTTFTSSLPALDFATFTKIKLSAGTSAKKALDGLIARSGVTEWSVASTAFSVSNGKEYAPFMRINWTGLPQGLNARADGDSDNDPSIYDYRISIPNFDGDLSNAVVERYPRSTYATTPSAKSGADRTSQRTPEAWLQRRPAQKLEYHAEAKTKRSLNAKVAGKTAPPVAISASAEQVKVTTMFYPPNRGKFAPTLAATTNDARTQANAQAIAALQGQALLGRIEKTGLSVKHFFKCFNLPVKITLNAPITPGAIDGLTVNAQVTMGSVGLDAHAPDSRSWLKARPRLRVKFAHADLSAALLDATEKTPPQRLSLVTDSRWVWHEFGHVLIAAATGDLELPFVHSVGDGLAAIIHDADSSLRDNAGPRGATFPWVSLPRRHDRCPDRGWCWSGGLHQPSRFWTDSRSGPPYKAYTTEQIMSSTLFWMYQAMGGDKTELEKRKAASDNAVSLIIVALALLGPSMHVDADSVQHFVAALLDADECLGTGAADHIIGAFSTKFKMPLSV